MTSGDVYRRRLLVSVDARGYGGSDDLRQDEIQRLLPEVLDTAADRAGLHRGEWGRQPAGDGELAVLPDSESEPGVVDDYVRELHAVLGRKNRNLRSELRLRLRLAIHHGMAKPAPMGYSGQGVVEVSRLVDCTIARAALAASGADLAVILSRRVFEDTVRQSHISIPATGFRRVTVWNKELRDDAWLYVPGCDVLALDLADTTVAFDAGSANGAGGPVDTGRQAGGAHRPSTPEVEPDRTRRAGHGEQVHTTIHDAVFYDATFGIRNQW